MPSRILKESICVSPDIDSLSESAECLFYRLLVNCDDYGRFYATPTVVASKCFPLRRRMSEDRVAKLLNELLDAGLIEVYLHEDRAYLHMPSWAKHQGAPRAKESRFPEQTSALVSDCMQMSADADKCRRIRSSGLEVRIRSSYSLSGAPGVLEFNEFWTAYPRKIGKLKAREAWDKRVKAGADPQTLIDGAKRFAEWVSGGGLESPKFIPHPTTWLNQGRDEDELPDPASLESISEPKGFAALRKIREVTGGGERDDVRRVGADSGRAARGLPAAGDSA